MPRLFHLKVRQKVKLKIRLHHNQMTTSKWWEKNEANGQKESVVKTSLLELLKKTAVFRNDDT